MIDVRDLTYIYPASATPAVEGASFRVERGEVFGFLGPSGAGKSTIQKVLIRLLREYRGNVSVLERDLGTWGSDYYERIGVSFELPYHYQKLTALENLEYFRALYPGPTDDPRALLDLVGLADDADKRVAAYSKGMQMRLSFVRALLHRPELLFLDEPTAGLDPGTSRRVRDIIQERREAGTTVFLATHDMNVADELCDRVAFIVAGRIVLVDSPGALKMKYGERSVRIEFKRDGRLDDRAFPLAGLGDNEAFLDVLRTADVQTLHSQETTLEGVFHQVTGATLV